MAAAAQEYVLRVIPVDPPRSVAPPARMVDGPHVVDIVALDKKHVADLTRSGCLGHFPPGVHVPDSMIRHHRPARPIGGADDAPGVGDARGQRLLHEGVGAEFQRHDGLIGVQVVRSGHGDDVRPCIRDQRPKVVTGNGIGIERPGRCKLGLDRVEQGGHTGAAALLGHVRHVFAGAAATAQK